MRKLISVVISAFNEELVIEELARQLKVIFDSLPQYDFEVIFVENGSTDRTYEKMLKIRGEDLRFKILRLSRNLRWMGNYSRIKLC